MWDVAEQGSSIGLELVYVNVYLGGQNGPTGQVMIASTPNLLTLLIIHNSEKLGPNRRPKRAIMTTRGRPLTPPVRGWGYSTNREMRLRRYPRNIARSYAAKGLAVTLITNLPLCILSRIPLVDRRETKI